MGSLLTRSRRSTGTRHRYWLLDIPTGINGDTGQVLGCAVDADLTVTFVGLKSGLFLGAGLDHCGEIRFAGLDIPDAYRETIEPAFRRIDDEFLPAC